MPTNSRDPKTRALRRHSALNPRSDKVQDPLFREHPFFDPRDLVQVKYEMLRCVRKAGVSVSESARRFGVTRPTWYRAQRAYDRGGLPALVPARPGPRRPRKLTDRIVATLRRAKAARPELRSRELVELVQREFGLSVHRRTVERALARKKKRFEWGGGRSGP